MARGRWIIDGFKTLPIELPIGMDDWLLVHSYGVHDGKFVESNPKLGLLDLLPRPQSTVVYLAEHLSGLLMQEPPPQVSEVERRTGQDRASLIRYSQHEPRGPTSGWNGRFGAFHFSLFSIPKVTHTLSVSVFDPILVRYTIGSFRFLKLKQQQATFPAYSRRWFGFKCLLPPTCHPISRWFTEWLILPTSH